MSSSNSITNNTNNNNNTNTNNNNNNNNTNNSTGLGAATYYGAVAVVVFVLLALTITSRILYTRRARRQAQNRPALDPEMATQREEEERLAMERRGEESGLPTYRQSVLGPNPDTVLAATPITATPFARSNASTDTLPTGLPISHVTSPNLTAADPENEPPKYEDSPLPDEPPPPAHTTQQLSPTRMRQRDSVVTLVLPSIRIDESELSPRVQVPDPVHQTS